MKITALSVVFLVCRISLFAQFVEDFNQNTSPFQENGIAGWTARTGDGQVIFKQKVQDGVASLMVDAFPDTRNIWYAFIHRVINEQLDVSSWVNGEFELKIYAKVKPSHGPRRINLFLSAIGGSEYLREFDLEEPDKWYEISMTTQGFKIDNNQPVLCQISLMDWGIKDTFQLDVDYIKVGIIHKSDNSHDLGYPIKYRPAPAQPSSFDYEVKVANDAMISSLYPDLNFNDWINSDSVYILNVSSSNIVVLSWDFEKYKGKKIKSDGQLELITHSLYRKKSSGKDFGEIRLIEIIDHHKDWKEEDVTYNSLVKEHSQSQIFNQQTIVDFLPIGSNYQQVLLTLTKPVLQRLIEGKSSGLALMPLGAVDANFISKENDHEKFAATIRFNLE